MLEESTTIRAGTITCEKTRKLKILKSLHKLIHACKCTHPSCPEMGCEEMKILVVHFKMCTKKRKRRDCHLCTQLLALCFYHAKNSKDCEAVHCVVPYCAEIKFKFYLKKGVHPKEETDMVFCGPGFISENDGIDVGQSSGNLDESQSVEEPIEASSRSDEDSQFLDQLEEDLDLLLANSEFPLPPEPVVETVPERRYSNLDIPHNLYNELLLRKLLHAQTCLSDEERGVARWPCFETECGVMKNVIRHISQCHLDGECTRIYCASAKFLLSHWRNCEDRDCALCKSSRTHAVASGVQSFPDVCNDWKRGMLPTIRDEIVDYAVALLIARCKEYKDSMKIFVKEIEDFAFLNFTTKSEYCKIIAARLYCFSVDPRIRGYEVAEPEVIRLFQAVLSSHSSSRQSEIIDCLKTHPPVMEAFIKRRLNRTINANPYRFCS